jgi:hypothetical protein
LGYGCSGQSVPSLSNTAILSATGIKDALAVSVAALTHWVMRCAVPSFQEGRGLATADVPATADVSFFSVVLQWVSDKLNKSSEASVIILIFLR